MPLFFRSIPYLQSIYGTMSIKLPGRYYMNKVLMRAIFPMRTLLQSNPVPRPVAQVNLLEGNFAQFFRVQFKGLIIGLGLCCMSIESLFLQCLSFLSFEVDYGMLLIGRNISLLKSHVTCRYFPSFSMQFVPSDASTYGLCS